MASIRKKGKRWLVEVRKKGFYRSKTFDTKLNAQTWAVEMEQYASPGSSLVRGKTVLDALNRYEKEVSKGRKGDRREEHDLLADGERILNDELKRHNAEQS